VRVQCPLCKKRNFVLTDKYNPKVLPNGGMVKWVGPFPHIDWLQASTTLWSSMTCPECCAMLAPSGRLTVVFDISDGVDPSLAHPLPSSAASSVQSPPAQKADIKIKVEKKVKEETDDERMDDGRTEDGDYVCKQCGLKYGKPMHLIVHSKTHKVASGVGA